MKKSRSNYFILIFMMAMCLMQLIGMIQPIKSTSATMNNTVPRYLTIRTEGHIINSVRYKDSILQAEKITTDIGPGYCLEIEKNYPSGQQFELLTMSPSNVKAILAAGYPNRSAEELGVSSDDDAYFATQIALWCSINGYDVKKIKASDKKIEQAIINIYNEGSNGVKYSINNKLLEYYYNDSVQRVLIYVQMESSIPDQMPDDGSGSSAANPDNDEDLEEDVVEDEEDSFEDDNIVNGRG